MKALFTCIFIFIGCCVLLAQSPSACFRNWQHRPLLVEPPPPVDSGLRWTLSDIVFVDSLVSEANAWFDIGDYYTAIEGCYGGPVYVTNLLDPVPADKIPAGAVFCRLETYTYLKCHVMVSIHAGGFNEKDEIDH